MSSVIARRAFAAMTIVAAYLDLLLFGGPTTSCRSFSNESIGSKR
jgi:hypothetical protein